MEGLIPLLASFDELLRQQDGLLALAYQNFRSLGRQVVKCLPKDDILFYEGLLQDCREFLGPKDVKQLWQVVRRSPLKYQQRRMGAPPFQLKSVGAAF